jgi:hypothetical protein
MSVKLQENIWLSASRLVTQEIRLLLAEDARCLLFTIDFQQFINDVFENVLLISVSNIEVKGDTTNWLILSLPLPLKLSGFRDCNPDNNYNYSIELEIDEDKRLLQVPISPKQISQLTEYDWDVIFQWNNLTRQLETDTFDFSTFDQSQQAALRREISCLICFVAQLLHSSSQVNAFTYP